MSGAIRSFRVNSVARSLTIEYEPASLPPALWTRFLTGDEEEVADSSLSEVLQLVIRRPWRCRSVACAARAVTSFPGAEAGGGQAASPLSEAWVGLSKSVIGRQSNSE